MQGKGKDTHQPETKSTDMKTIIVTWLCEEKRCIGWTIIKLLIEEQSPLCLV